MFFFDPNYVMIANNPAIVPRSFVRPPKNVGYISFFLKVVEVSLPIHEYITIVGY